MYYISQHFRSQIISNKLLSHTIETPVKITKKNVNDEVVLYNIKTRIQSAFLTSTYTVILRACICILCVKYNLKSW